MKVTDTVKKAPRWAWYITAGVVMGVVVIRVWKGRATDTTETTVTATETGQPLTTGAPSPAIVSPVVIQAGEGGGTDYSGIFGLFGDALGNAMNTIGGLAQGDQNLAGIAIIGTQDIAKDLLAQGGSAPQPVQQLPPIQVNVPTVQAPTPRPTPTPASCPSSYPRHNPANGDVGANSCYRCEKRTGTFDKNYPYVHRYQNGKAVAVRAAC